MTYSKRGSNRIARTAVKLAISSVLWMGSAHLLPAQTVTTVAGGYLGDGEAATQAAFTFAPGVAQDASGNYYVSDLIGQRIRRIDSQTGRISTIAGTGIQGYNGDGIPAATAQVNFPAHLRFDPLGNLIFSDSGNCRVRRIDSSGIITTIAGNGTCGYSGDGGPATSAALGNGYGIGYDPAGNLYITDFANNVVRMVDTAGVIHTVAGSGTAGYAGDGGPATQAQLNFPIGVQADTSGNIYIADSGNSRVRRLNKLGVITTLAGNGTNAFSGDGGPATAAAVGKPRGLAFHNGTLYMSNGGDARIRSVNTSTNIINTFAGSSTGFDGDGYSLASSQFDLPSMIIFNSAGKLVVADTLNGRIRQAGSTMSTIAGGYVGDGAKATSAAFLEPEAVAFDLLNDYYIADETGNRIRKVNSLTGEISTVAGTGISGYSGDGGGATNAQLWFPAGVAVDWLGNIFISDSANNVIRRVNILGTISTFARSSQFVQLGHIVLDLADNLYVVDSGACVVWKITPAGTVSPFAGVPNSCGYNGDHIRATAATLNTPYGLGFDPVGNLYIADSSNCIVRKVDLTGTITTVAGNGNCAYAGDRGPATAASLCFPEDVVANAGSIYIADTYNLVIRRVAGGTITTYAGTGAFGYNGDGLPALSTNFDDPVALARNNFGTLFTLDDEQLLLRKIQ